MAELPRYTDRTCGGYAQAVQDGHDNALKRRARRALLDELEKEIGGIPAPKWRSRMMEMGYQRGYTDDAKASLAIIQSKREAIDGD